MLIGYLPHLRHPGHYPRVMARYRAPSADRYNHGAARRRTVGLVLAGTASCHIDQIAVGQNRLQQSGGRVNLEGSIEIERKHLGDCNRIADPINRDPLSDGRPRIAVGCPFNSRPSPRLSSQRPLKRERLQVGLALALALLRAAYSSSCTVTIARVSSGPSITSGKSKRYCQRSIKRFRV